VAVEHANGVPGRKYTLSRSQLRSHTSTSRLIIALSAPALAVAAIAATGGLTGSPATGGLTGSAAARPVIPAHSVSTAPPGPAHAAASTAANSAATLTVQATAATRHRLGWKKEIAWKMMSHRFGWRPKYQFRSLNRLWEHESSWRIHAYNPYSGAYGIPQAVPGSKMGSAGPDWRNSARTQIRWGLRYIRSRYGKPRHAWAHEAVYGWY
jgi:hypothetical protein